MIVKAMIPGDGWRAIFADQDVILFEMPAVCWVAYANYHPDFDRESSMHYIDGMIAVDHVPAPTHLYSNFLGFAPPGPDVALDESGCWQRRAIAFPQAREKNDESDSSDTAPARDLAAP